MKPERWQQVNQLFHAALGREPHERVAFLEQACAGDDELRKEVEALLAYEQAGSFIEQPALEVEAQMITHKERRSAGYTVGFSETVDHYRIIEHLGSGGMGEVYLAQDLKLGRKVALKLLPQRFTEDAVRLRRFEQEARAASALNHSNILTIYEIGQAGSTHYIATEFVDGTTLRAHIAGKPLKNDETISLVIQIGNALAAAHAKGIIHRDIKPENIMLRRAVPHTQTEPHVKVLDFGIAKLMDTDVLQTDMLTRPISRTSEGVVIGTTPYMSPEQLREEAVDARTDIWSLGIVLYEMLAGRRPFDGDTSADVRAAILKDEMLPLSSEVPHALKSIVKKALHKDRTERYQNMGEMLNDLQRLQSGTEKTANTMFKSVSIVLLGLLILVGVVYFLLKRSPKVEEPAPIRRLAVLSFINATGDQNLEYVADGMTESLTNNLSQLPGLTVIAQSSASEYKGKHIDVREMADTLKVEALVTGRIVAQGDDLQVTVALDRANNTRIWGDQYHCQIADLRAIPLQISQAISQKLNLPVSTAAERQLNRHPTENAEAYRLYLNAEYYSRGHKIEDHLKALDYYNQAITLDPKFALAYLGVASQHAYFVNTSLVLPKETHAKQKTAVQKALELDDSLAQAHTMLAKVYLDEWNWSEAEREFQRAIELNSNLADAREMYALYLSEMGRHTEALVQVKRAQELDPLHRWSEGVILYMARHYDEAIRTFQNLAQLRPDYPDPHLFLGFCYGAKGMHQEAIAEYQKFIRLQGRLPGLQIWLGYAYAQSGKRDEALSILKKLKTSKDYVSPAELAVLYAGLEDKDGAFEALEQAYREHDAQLQFLKVERYYDSLRSDPRFTDLMRRVGLPL